METIQEIQLDCEELKKLLNNAIRPNNRHLIATEMTKLETMLSNQSAASDTSNSTTEVAQTDKPKANTQQSKKPTLYTTKITSYGWDETQSSVKIYVSLPQTSSITQDNVTVDYKEHSFDLTVSNLNGKNHNLSIKNLLDGIVPSKCTHKLKSDSVVINLHKAEKKTWQHLTQSMKTKTDAKTPKMDKDKDPGDSIMGMMKQMYEDGDDEMKKTIAKAWTESRNKQGPGGMDLGAMNM